MVALSRKIKTQRLRAKEKEAERKASSCNSAMSRETKRETVVGELEKEKRA